VNPLLASFIGGLLRQALVGVSGYLVARGIFTQDEMTNYVSAFVAFAIGFGWMLWVKYRDRIKLLSALTLDTPATEAQLETAMASTPSAVPSSTTPKDVKPSSTVAQKLMAVLLVVGVSVGAGCAKNRPDLTPELQVTVRATQVNEGMRAALPGLKAITCQTLEQQKAAQRLCLTPNETDKVAGFMETGFKHSQDIAAIAKIVSEARDEAEHKNAIGRLAVAARALQEALLAATISPELEGGRQSVIKLLSGVLSVLIAFTPVTPLP
jgi:hypothetical protein